MQVYVTYKTELNKPRVIPAGKEGSSLSVCQFWISDFAASSSFWKYTLLSIFLSKEKVQFNLLYENNKNMCKFVQKAEQPSILADQTHGNEEWCMNTVFQIITIIHYKDRSLFIANPSWKQILNYINYN